MSTSKRMMAGWVVCGLLVAVSARATDYTWLQVAGGSWSDTNNWVGGLVATGAANNAIFPAGAGATITVDQPSDVGSLTFPAGSVYTLSGAGTLASATIDVALTNQEVQITAPVVPATRFLKSGAGTLELSSLSAGSVGAVVGNGTLKVPTQDQTYVGLGDASTPANATVQFLLTTPGSWANYPSFDGWGNNFKRVLGGANTNGTVYYDWVNADGGYLGADNDLLFSAAAGGTVQIWNTKGNSVSPLVKIGPGTLRIHTWGNNDTDRSYAGGTTVRNGTLLLGEDDTGSTTNGYLLPNGRTSSGAGGSLGFSSFSNAVHLGDASYTLKGSGTDIWGTSDEFHCLAGALTNDGQLVTRVTYVQLTDGWAKSGLMMRESLSGGSKNVMMLVTPSNGTTFQWRDTALGESFNSGSSGSAPVWLKLVRSGSDFSGYRSADGVTWTLVGTASVSMSSVIYAGLVVCSHNSSVLARSEFAQVAGLPAGAQNADVGSGFPAGSAEYTGTLPTDQVSLLAVNSRWIGHALQVNPVGQSISIGAAEAGTCTFAGDITLKTNAYLTAPAGGDAVFSGLLAGEYGVVKTGAGVVRLTGTSTFAGATVVSQGQLKVEAPAVLQSTALVVVADGAIATVSAAVPGGSVLVKSGTGALTMAGTQSNACTLVVSNGTLRVGNQGLLEGRLAGAFNTTGANPGTAVVMTTRYANSTDGGPWVDNSTYVYSGMINNSAAAPVTFAFAEQFDDSVMLRIDGTTVLNNSGWNTQTYGTISLSPGWHTFDLRLGQGSFGVGPSAGGVDGTTGLGVAYSNAASGGWQSLTDNGNFLDAGKSTASYLSPSGTVRVAIGGVLDLSGSTQTVAGVSGEGVITNGLLKVSGQISPAGAGILGDLQVKGGLTVETGAVQNWDFSNDDADLVAVSGVLTLPAEASLNLNALAGSSYHGQRVVLYTFGSYSGATDLRGWTLNRTASVKVDLVNKQVVMLAPGLLLIIN